MEGAVLQDVQSSLRDCTGKVESVSVAQVAVGGDEEIVDVAVTTHEGGQLLVRASEKGYRLVEYAVNGAAVRLDREEDAQFESLHTLLSHHSKSYREG
eukprot:CAMPEP_0173406660 /NCGR_PEP_ID=MMETSP1356-20130122/65121_1 /TAXON_ID=77927 ORGANISM="Hemiselmis virescens, Strain PCC157" /NCGR_SAMPLE_ID=MMETSP1356 /ASSEMBLY_ACC=CAM_ASM_000847 /LENGTH=97 /DNA_ID=CAMNT_0014367687 /DNA_START=149 /DNA_END=438 /DNA_ORIENTATION=-